MERVVDRGARPDGTQRKAIKIRPGYVDPALAEKYDAGKRGGKPRGIPGMDPDDPPVQSHSATTTAAKKKRNRKKKGNSCGGGVDAVMESVNKLGLDEANKAVTSSPKEPTAEQVAEKKIKGLKKKLRQIDELAAKDAADLSQDQLHKLAKRANLKEELAEWEAKLT